MMSLYGIVGFLVMVGITFGNSNNCRDTASLRECSGRRRMGWCATEHVFYAVMSHRCPLTCGLCRRRAKGGQAKMLGGLSGSVNGFSLDLHSEMMKLDDVNNFVFSPFSVYNAMSMASLGAAGSTKQEIVTALGMFPQVHKALSSYNTSLALAGSENTTLSMANAMYLRPGEASNLNRGFQNKMKRLYGSHVREFQVTNPEKPINNWVEQVTNGEIKDFLADGSIDARTVMMIINAIYFKGKWKTQFDKRATRKADFKVSETRKADVEMMFVRGNFKFLKSKVLNAMVLDLPYEDSRYAMTIILPDVTTSLRDVISRMNRKTLDDVLKQLTMKYGIQLKMPKFALDTEKSMKELLRTLGINQAFGDQANFNKMTSTPVKISDVIHRAVIEVDEEGTVAAAATGVNMILRISIEPRFLEITVDRPFMFMIRDVQENVCLFSGQFVDPDGDVKMD